MRKKEWKVVITFHTTTEAIAMEAACLKEEIPGRLIPVPKQISSGCGLSWAMPAAWKEKIQPFLRKKGLGYESLGEYLI